MAERIAEAEKTFLGAGFFLVAPCAADGAIKLKFLDGREQRRNLQLVAADFTRTRNGDAVGDGVFNFADNQFCADFFGATVAEFIQFWKMMASIHVQKRHRNIRRTKRFFRQPHQTNGILAAGNMRARTLKFRRDFTHDVNRFRFEILQMVEMITAHC